jgi:hypothetical protein
MLPKRPFYNLPAPQASPAVALTVVGHIGRDGRGGLHNLLQYPWLLGEPRERPNQQLARSPRAQQLRHLHGRKQNRGVRATLGRT